MRRTTEFDKKMGKRILDLRSSKGLSRESIVQAIGVTNQQFAKYESGTNRLSVSRLLKIAEVLTTDPSYFYSEYQDSSSTNEHDDVESQTRIRMNLELARNLQNIDSYEIQDALLQLTRKIANHCRGTKLKTNKEDRNDD